MRSRLVPSSSRWLGCALFALAAPPAFAAPFVVSDVTYVHSAETTNDSHYYAPLVENVPDDWRSPVDYASGSVVVRLEVLSKPSDTPTRFQVCFEATPTYACTYQAPAYTDVGVYTWETPFSGFWSPGTVDWSQGINRAALILKDTSNGKPAPENVGEAVSALYMPTELRVTITLVPPGETYVPPEEQSEPDAGPDGAAEPDAGDVLDAGAPDAGPVDAGSADAGAGAGDAGAPPDVEVSADAGGAPPDAGADAGASDAGDADAGEDPAGDQDAGSEAPGDDAPPDDEASEPETAGCSSTGAGAPGAGLLLGGLLSFVRRRRAIARTGRAG